MMKESGIVVSEANRFIWPGPDLRMAKTGEPASMVYGYLPATFFETVKSRFIALAKMHKAKLIKRSQ